MSKHTWVEILFGWGYRVSRDGQILSLRNWRGTGSRIMCQHKNKDGYLCVRITGPDGRVRVPVHRLVAEVFVGPRPSEQHEVCHINGNKTDNYVRNLRWGTRKDNADDRERHGRTSRGKKHSDAIKCGIQSSNNPYWRHAR